MVPVAVIRRREVYICKVSEGQKVREGFCLVRDRRGGVILAQRDIRMMSYESSRYLGRERRTRE